jgi:hypothetical protein
MVGSRMIGTCSAGFDARVRLNALLTKRNMRERLREIAEQFF